MGDVNVQQGSLLLVPEHPLQVLPALAAEIGLNEAITVQQLHYWTQRSDDPEGWVYNTMEEWREQFPFWSESTIKRTWRSLRGQTLVEVRQRGGTDRTNHYRLVYENLPKYKFPSGQSDPIKGSKRPGASAQNDPLSSNKQRLRREPPSPQGGNAMVRDVFDFWVATLGKTRHELTAKRRRKVQARLSEEAKTSKPWSAERVAELKEAILGVTQSPHHMGTKPDSTRPYNDLELICRSRDKVEEFRDLQRVHGKRRSDQRAAGESANERRKRTRREQGLED